MNAEIESIRKRLWQEENCVIALKECDNRMMIMRKKAKAVEAGDKDVLMQEIFPKEYAWMAPLATRYYDDRRGWFKFLKALRDDSGWANKDLRWRRLQVFMRTTGSNASQFYARSMSAEAFEVYAASHKTQRGDRTKYTTWLRNQWTAQRRILEVNARVAKGDRLTQDEQQDITDKFWDDIRTQLDQGIYPTPPEGLFDR